MDAEQPVAPAPAPEAEVAPAPPVPPVVDEKEEEEERRKRRLLILLILLLLLLLLLGLLAGWYLAFRKPIDTLIPPIGSEVVPTYRESLYGASKPVGVAVSPTGDLVYVVESGGDRMTKVFDASGQVVDTLDPPDNGNHVPVYVALNPADGSAYVSDRATGVIYVYDKTGEYVRTFKPKVEIPNWQPIGMAFSPSGDLWVTDLSAPYHRIEVFGLDGTLKQEIGSEGQFNFPNMIAFDAAGNAYVTNSNDGRLMILEPTTGTELAGISRGAAEGNLGLPRGVAIDDRQHLFVVDATGQTIHMYRTGTAADWRPVFIGNFGTDGIGDGEFEYPNAIAVDNRARVYVTDRENDRVQVWGF